MLVRGVLSLVISFLSVQAWSQLCAPPNCAYVTDPVARQVLRVNATTNTTSQILAFPNKTYIPQDLTVGGDGFLYVALTSANRIVRVDPITGSFITIYLNTTTNSPQMPQGLRFAWNGDLYFNSTSGVWRLPASSIPTTSCGPNCPTAQPVATGLTITQPGGLAFQSNGDLLFAADQNVYRVAAGQSSVDAGIPTGSPVAILSTGENAVGLAVDSQDNIYVAHGTSVTRYAPAGTADPSNWNISFVVNSSNNYTQFIEAVPDTVNGANCNTANDLIWVNTYQLSSNNPPINGLIWRVKYTSTAAPGSPCLTDTVPSAAQVAAITTKIQGKLTPAVGMGVGASYRKLTKSYYLATSHVFNYGGFSHQLDNNLLGSTTSLPCSSPVLASVTEAQAQAKVISQILSYSDIDATPIALFGEEGWITTFLMTSLPACFDPISNHFLAGFFKPVNPRVVDIPANFDGADPVTLCNPTTDPNQCGCDPNLPVPNGCAQYTTLNGYYPSGPLGGAAGDPGIIIGGSHRLVLVNAALDANYLFFGFLPPLTDPVSNPLQNTFNATQNITFKFKLYTDFVGGSLVGDTEAQNTIAPSTVFSVGRVFPSFFAAFVDPSGGSIKTPPSFKYDAATDQFVYTLDAAALNAPLDYVSVYEATVVGNSFLPHSVRFAINNCRSGVPCQMPTTP